MWTGGPQIRPPRSPEAGNWKIALLLIAMVEHSYKEWTETLEATEAVEAIKVTEATEAEVLLKV